VTVILIFFGKSDKVIRLQALGARGLLKFNHRDHTVFKRKNLPDQI